MQASSSTRTIIMLTSLFLLAGCGEKPPIKLVTAQGIVRINGEPAADILIQAAPDVGIKADAIGSSATSGSDGKFSLIATDGRTGAQPGKTKIYLVDINEERPAQGQQATRKPRVSSKYSVGGEGLTVDIVDGQQIELNLN